MDLATALTQSGAFKVKDSVVATDYYPFGGGLDLMDPPTVVPPGSIIGCSNYEPAVRGGYRRIDGYEAFDGRPSPSDAAFVAIPLANVTGVAVSETIYTSGGTPNGVVAFVDVVNVIVVAVQVTTPVAVGPLTIGANNYTVTSAPYVDDGPTTALAAQYEVAKFQYLVQAVRPLPYTSVLGIFPYLDTVYAIASDGTQGHFYKATLTGWQELALGIRVQFTAGVYQNSMQPPPEGTVVTGATSGASFTIQRINAMTGTWGTDAAGWLVTSAITGTPVAGETFNAPGPVAVFTYQSQAVQTLPATGYYNQFRTHNFNAVQNPATGFRLYAVNGVAQAFEYDGYANVFCLIDTGNTPDTPSFLECHADYLFFGFPGGGLQNSGYQLPLNWNTVFGASARSVGGEITSMYEDVSATLVIGTRRRIWMLSGISTELFQVSVYSGNTGMLPNSCAQLGQLVFMEDRGFTTVAASQEFGDFEAQSLSDKIANLAVSLAVNDTVVNAIVTRRKNLYRIFFKSGTILALGINASGKFTGWTQCGYPVAPTLVSAGFTQALTSGPEVERSFFADADGYVYENDIGWTCNGTPVNAFLKMAYYPSKSPDIYKRYRKLRVDLAPEGYSALNLAVDFDYGGRDAQANYPLQYAGVGGLWDVATWDTFLWDSPQYTQAEMKVEGEGYNIGLFFASNQVTDHPLTLYGASLQWSRRILNRNTGSD